MSSLSERLAVARREAVTQDAEARAGQARRDEEARRRVDEWNRLGDDLSDPGDVESDSTPDSENGSPPPPTTEEDGSDGTNSSASEELEGGEREPLVDRARAAGAAALESAGVIALGQLSRITDRMQARDDRKRQAREDYNDVLDRPIDQLLTDDREILGSHTRGLFRDRARRKADGLVEKISQAEGVKDSVTMREKYLDARKNFTQVRINKLEGRIAKSSNNLLTKHLNAWRREKLHDLNAKNKKRADTISHTEKKRQEKPEEIRKKVDETVKKKVDAMYKKAQRVALRERGIRKHNTLRRHEFLANLTPEYKTRIVREAIRQVRKKNIERGTLGAGYQIDDILDEESVRKVTSDYGRIVK